MDHIAYEITGKWFYGWKVILPELKPDQFLILSWLIDRGVVQDKRTDRYRDIRPVNDPQFYPNDKGWIHCEYRHIQKAFPFFTTRLLKDLLARMRKNKLIQSSKFSLPNCDYKTPVTHLKILKWPLLRDSFQNSFKKLDAGKNQYLRFRDGAKEFMGTGFFKIEKEDLGRFKSATEVVLFYWLLDRLKIGKWVGADVVKKWTGIYREMQTKCLKSMGERGLLETAYSRERGLAKKRHITIHSRAVNAAIDEPQTPRMEGRKRRESKEGVKKESKNSRLPALRADQSRVNGWTPNTVKTLFGPDIQTSTKPQHLEWAKSLHRAIKSAKLKYLQSSMTKWAEEFRKLENDLTKDEFSKNPVANSECSQNVKAYYRISSVLDWYCSHIKVKFVPQCDSAKSFRAKFPRVEKAKLNHVDHISPQDLSPKARTVYENLARIPWPFKAAEKLPAVLQKSIDTIQSFRDRARKYMAENGLDDRNRPDPKDRLRTFVKDTVLPYVTVERLVTEPIQKLAYYKREDASWEGKDLHKFVVDDINDLRFKDSSGILWSELFRKLNYEED